MFYNDLNISTSLSHSRDRKKWPREWSVRSDSVSPVKTGGERVVVRDPGINKMRECYKVLPVECIGKKSRDQQNVGK